LASKEELEARRARVVDLDAQGYTEREIAHLLDVSEQTIWNDMRALRNDPQYFRSRIYNLFQRGMNLLDLKDPQDRRCFFNNVSHLVGKTMPVNTNMQVKGEILNLNVGFEADPDLKKILLEEAERQRKQRLDQTSTGTPQTV